MATFKRKPYVSIYPAAERFDSFPVSLDVVIRPCCRGDLPTLDRLGLFATDRDLIEATFQQQAAGKSIMLVAEANGVAAGQVWLDLTRFDLDCTGVIWALRVIPRLQNRGLGTRLIHAAERILAERGFRRAELSVEKTNVSALRLYKRLGYRPIKTTPGTDGYITADRVPICVPSDQHLLRKSMRRVSQSVGRGCHRTGRGLLIAGSRARISIAGFQHACQQPRPQGNADGQADPESPPVADEDRVRCQYQRQT